MRTKLLFISLLLLSQIGAKAQIFFSPNADNQATTLQNTLTSTANNQMLIGYSPDEVASNGALGINTSATLGHAIYIPAEMAKKFSGNDLIAIWFGLSHTESVSNFNVFVKTDLESNEALVFQSVPSIVTGWNKIELDSSFKIEEEGFYIGVTYSVNTYSFAFGISGSDTKNASFFLNEKGEWLDFSEVGYGRVNILGLTEGENFPQDEASLEKVFTDEYYYQPEEPITMYGIFQNWGKNAITNYDLAVKFNNGEEHIFPQTTYIANRESGSFSNLQLPTLSNETETRRYPVSFTIKNINGATDKFSESLSTEVFVYSGTTLERKTLLEQFTTEECTKCPNAQLTLKAAVKNDKNIAWVAHHVGFETDKFTIAASEYFLPFYGSPNIYAPAMMLDRTWFPSTGFDVPVFEISTSPSPSSIIKKAKSQPSFITVNIGGYYTEETNEVKVVVYGESLIEPSFLAENPLVNVFLTEDGIISQTQKIANTYIKDYQHDNLIRKVVTHPYGDEMIWNGKEYTYTTTFNIDSSWKKDQLKVIAFVHNLDTDIYNSRVLNTEWVKLLEMDPTVNITNNTVDNIILSCENREIQIQGEYDTFEIYNFNGVQVTNNNLLPGIYIVKILSDKKIITKKIMCK